MAGGNIVVGVDGSSEARRALAWATEEAQRRRVPLDVVYVYDVAASWHTYAIGPAGAVAIPEAEDEARSAARVAHERADTLLRQELEQVGAPADVIVHRIAAEDPRPARTLVEMSHDAELLVLGNRGRGGFRGLLLGSVSQQCVHHAACPVVVVRDDERAGANGPRRAQ